MTAYDEAMIVPSMAERKIPIDIGIIYIVCEYTSPPTEASTMYEEYRRLDIR